MTVQKAPYRLARSTGQFVSPDAESHADGVGGEDGGHIVGFLSLIQQRKTGDEAVGEDDGDDAENAVDAASIAAVEEDH